MDVGVGVRAFYSVRSADLSGGKIRDIKGWCWRVAADCGTAPGKECCPDGYHQSYNPDFNVFGCNGASSKDYPNGMYCQVNRNGEGGAVDGDGDDDVAAHELQGLVDELSADEQAAAVQDDGCCQCEEWGPSIEITESMLASICKDWYVCVPDDGHIEHKYWGDIHTFCLIPANHDNLHHVLRMVSKTSWQATAAVKDMGMSEVLYAVEVDILFTALRTVFNKVQLRSYPNTDHVHLLLLVPYQVPVHVPVHVPVQVPVPVPVPEVAGPSTTGSRALGDSVNLTAEEQLHQLAHCVVCLDAPRSVVLLPCKHMVLCPECLKQLDAAAEARFTPEGAIRRTLLCPVCREPAEQRLVGVILS
eukprot:gene9142-9310_t